MQSKLEEDIYFQDTSRGNLRDKLIFRAVPFCKFKEACQKYYKTNLIIKLYFI